jgi:hypothetical protein
MKTATMRLLIIKLSPSPVTSSFISHNIHLRNLFSDTYNIYAKFEVFTAAKIQVVVFWKMEAAWYSGNVGTLLQHYTAPQPRRPRLEVLVYVPLS